MDGKRPQLINRSTADRVENGYRHVSGFRSAAPARGRLDRAREVDRAGGRGFCCDRVRSAGRLAYRALGTDRLGGREGPGLRSRTAAYRGSGGWWRGLCGGSCRRRRGASYATALVVARLRRAGGWVVRAKPIAPAAAAFAAIGYKAPGASRIGHLALSDWADAKDPAYRRTPPTEGPGVPPRAVAYGGSGGWWCGLCGGSCGRRRGAS